MRHQWAALAVGRAIRDQTGGVLVDVLVDRLVPRFVRATTTVDALEAVHRDLVSTWTWVLYSPDEHGTYWMTTDGLQRFGLPELSLPGVPGGHVHDGRGVLMGLAHRLVVDQASEIGRLTDPPAFRALARHWVISPADMAAAYPPGSAAPWPTDSVTLTLVETANDVRTGVPMLEVVFT